MEIRWSKCRVHATRLKCLRLWNTSAGSIKKNFFGGSCPTLPSYRPFLSMHAIVLTGDTRAALVLYLCTHSQADPLKLTLLRYFLKTGTESFLCLRSFFFSFSFSTLEAAPAQHASTVAKLKTRSSRNPNRNNK
eukprot:1152970-Pelagomonas_calceolata.AAC.1